MTIKTLLIAAAALAATVISTEAQPVFSQNVVGYAQVVLHGNGQFTLVANPFDDGNGNYTTNLVNSSLPKQSQILTWDPILGYNTAQKVGTPPAWPTTASAQTPPGVGFFVRNGGVGSGAPDLTNTFIGSVVVPSAGSITNAEPVGFTLQGSTIPYAGNIANSGQAGGDTNLDYGSGLTKQSQILTWDPVLGFNTVQKVGATPTWNGTASVGIGQGFFINNKNGPATNMVQNADY
jgi:hypothetical protein